MKTVLASYLVPFLLILVLATSFVRPGDATGLRGLSASETAGLVSSTENGDGVLSSFENSTTGDFEYSMRVFSSVPGKPIDIVTSSIERKFSINCTNQEERVLVVGKDDEDVWVKCKNRPSEMMDRTVCRQFNKATFGFLVWQVCPEMCSIATYVCNPGCVNQRKTVMVLDKKSKKRTIKCGYTSGKNSKYCLQFNSDPQRKLDNARIFNECPLMCPFQSGCFQD